MENNSRYLSLLIREYESVAKISIYAILDAKQLHCTPLGGEDSAGQKVEHFTQGLHTARKGARGSMCLTTSRGEEAAQRMKVI